MITDEQKAELKELIKELDAVKLIQTNYNSRVSKFLTESKLSYGAYIFYINKVRKEMRKNKLDFKS